MEIKSAAEVRFECLMRPIGYKQKN
jgi:hypothetical protein